MDFYRWGTATDTAASPGTRWIAQTAPTALTGSVVEDFANPAFGDVDGDGDLDLLVGGADGKLHFFRRGTATDGTDADSDKSWTAVTGTDNPFDAPQDDSPFDVGFSATPTFGDVDGDGDTDLVVGNNDGTLNIWYWNDVTDMWQTTSDL